MRAPRGRDTGATGLRDAMKQKAEENTIWHAYIALDPELYFNTSSHLMICHRT